MRSAVLPENTASVITTPPSQYGFPMKLSVPTKLGFKNPNHNRDIEIGNDFTGGLGDLWLQLVQRSLGLRLFGDWEISPKKSTPPSRISFHGRYSVS
jgi:DMSO/TMAO reductase YedYZ molybdopterin-dependent catalytic subunit